MASGVNTYGNIPPTVLSIAEGDQIPEIPLGEVKSKIGAVVPLQNGGIVVKSGTVLGIIDTLKVCVTAH